MDPAILIIIPKVKIKGTERKTQCRSTHFSGEMIGIFMLIAVRVSVHMISMVGQD
jgi:hypothetical protein